ncbi:DnaJ family domain-containing protein [Priestia flexa]|uniref:DnaJ family domain-containing protein n=1 Tax=Priestia flexa TaxID=86664 RepID=UPI0032EDA1CD
MDIAHIIAEEKIKQAINDGDFDNLPGAGKPLELEDLSHIPEELRQAYRMMKNAGMVSDEKQLKKEVITLEQLAAVCKGDEKADVEQKLTEKKVRLQQIVKQKGMASSPSYRQYQRKIHAKFFD